MNVGWMENSLEDEDRIVVLEKEEREEKTRTVRKKLPILFSTEERCHFYFLESTPMREQYLRVKAEHHTKLVLFQRGSFYQAYLADARVIKERLGYNWKEK